MFSVLAWSRPIVGGEVSQTPHAMHAAIPRTIVILLSNADVCKHDLLLRIHTRFVGKYPIPAVF
jgi:hypothetical protein